MTSDVAMDDQLTLAAWAEKHAGERAPDIAAALNELSAESAAEVLLHLPPERAVEVLDSPELTETTEIVSLLSLERAAPLLSGMSADRVAHVLRAMEPPDRAALAQRLDAESRESMRSLLGYPEQSAGSLMTTEFVSVPSDWTVGQTLEHIRKVERTRETIYAIYVCDPRDNTLLQAVTLRGLVVAEPGAPVLSAARPRRPITVPPLADREEAARLISKYDLLAIPVVDEEGHVLGIVTVDDIIDAILQESAEDVQRFGGVAASGEPYLRTGFVSMVRKRAGWLSVLFVGETLTASTMQFFHGEIEKAIVLTLFIPLIMGSGGNAGSQATSLLIRALALGELRLHDWWRVVLREVPAGLVLGTILATIGIARIVLWQKLGIYDYGPHWMLVALTVASALVGIVTFGSLAGSMLPFVLQRFGFDPASASAPFVATLVDVTGLVIYFGVATSILSGTLL
ncbi:MAG TPA: magnesium transporter [Xanthobacteraceae bacterium]|nr:magnesium transporter [Xanthobacteraceae bacterium]